MNREPRDADWSSLTDALLRGVAHALSNRTGALTALRDLGASDAEGRELLTGEIGRLTQLIQLLRLIPGEPGSSPEALDVASVVADAVAVLGLHPQVRDVRWAVAASGAPQPVRAERWVLLRSLMLLLAGALADSVAHGARELRVTTTGDALVTVVAAAAGDGAPHWREPTEYARALADRMGAELSWGAGALELRLPTLAEARRREGARGAEAR